MRYSGILCAAILSVFAVSAGQATPPVVVELFTSEGCSSCPPADAVLQRLDAGVAGADVIALGEHVTYWDRLGWKDRFSADLYTQRQEEYGRRFRLGSVYTPQMVVNGQVEFVGVDEARARKEIANAALRQAGRVELKVEANSVAVHALDLPQEAAGAEVLLAITETDLNTDVRAGENGGRKLHHSGVVRSLVVIGRVESLRRGAGGVGFSGQAQLHLASTWKRENLKLVAFVQDRVTGRIWSASALAP